MSIRKAVWRLLRRHGLNESASFVLEIAQQAYQVCIELNCLTLWRTKRNAVA